MNKIKLPKFYKLGFGVAAIGLIVYVGYIASKPVALIDQRNTAPYDHTYVLATGKSLEQSFTQIQNNISDISVQYLPDLADAEQQLVFELLINGQPQRRVEGKLSGFRTNETFRSLPQAELLLFSFHPVPTSAGAAVSFRLTSLTHSLKFPVQRDPLKYEGGQLIDPKLPWQGDLGFKTFYRPSLHQRLKTDFIDNAHLHRLVVIFIIGLAIAVLGESWQRWRAHRHLFSSPPVLLMLLLTLVFTLPLYLGTNMWGVWDWPEAASHFSAARHSFAVGQWPLWNPFFCGGSPSWGNPQAYWPSFLFLLAVLFGDVIGFQVAATLYIWLGLIGMFLLARELRMNRAAALLTAILFMNSGFLAAHLSAGQILWLTVTWIPWVLYFFLRSLKRPWFIVPSVLFYLLIFLAGRVQIVAYVAMLLLLLGVGLLIAMPGRKVVVRSLLFFGLLTLGLGAVKIFPTLDFLHGLHGTLQKNDGIPWLRLGEVLTTRTTALLYHQPWMQLYWHEYAAYIGIIPLLAALIGIWAIRRQKRVRAAIFLATGIVFLTLATAKAGSSPFDHVPVFDSLRNHGRAIVFLILPIALLAGIGVQYVGNRISGSRRQQLITTIIAIMVFVDLALVARTGFTQVFSAQPISYTETHPSFVQVQGFIDVGYHIIEAGYGAHNYCTPQLVIWNSQAKIFGLGDENYRGEVYTSSETALTMTTFTPNQLTIEVAGAPKHNDIGYVNQKYDSGWYSPEKKLFADQGRIAFALDINDAGRIIHVRYWPRSFSFGLGISGATVLILIGLYGWQKNRVS